MYFFTALYVKLLFPVNVSSQDRSITDTCVMAKDTKACGVISGIGMANNHVTAHTYGDRNQRHHMTANRDDGNPTHHVMTSSGDGNLRHHISAPVCEEKPTNHLTAAGEITRYLNVYNAKLMAVVFVVGSIIYHGIIHLYFGECPTFNF